MFKIDGFFNEINPFRICKIPFGREISLRNVKYALRRVDLFHFTESVINIKGHYSLTNQLERSGTSIGANIHEANYAHSKNDFISKLQIALKECYESEYWLELFVKSELLDRDKAKETYNECGTIRKTLISSINTAKQNTEKSK